MSLINDALKRASESVQEQGGEPASGAPMQPVDGPPKKKLPGWLIPTLLVIVLGAAAWFFYQAYQGRKSSTAAAKGTNAVTAKSSTNVAVAAAKPTEAGAKPAEGKTTNAAATRGYAGILNRAAGVADKVSAQNKEGEAASQTIEKLPVAEAPPAVTPAPTPVAVVATPPPVAVVETPAPAPTSPNSDDGQLLPPNAEFPTLKLQAIYYRISKPSAVINGQSVREGKIVDGVRVKKIERDSVTLELGARTRVLSLK